MLNFEVPRWFRLLRRRTFQTVGLVGFWGFCEWAKQITRTPIPGAVIGLMLLIVLLGTGWLPIRAIQHGTKLLMGEMLLFFVPPMLSLLDYPQFLGILGLKLLVAISLGTLGVMLATALTIECCHWAIQSRRWQ